MPLKDGRWGKGRGHCQALTSNPHQPGKGSYPQAGAAEDRIRELEAHVRHYQERADRAEKWLHRISLEIEQKFFSRDDSRPAQSPPPQALLRSQRQ
jgi:hypothetical protein